MRLPDQQSIEDIAAGAAFLGSGGAVIIPADIPGVRKLLRPEHNAVANAIGASISQVSGQYEKIYSLDRIERKAAIQEVIFLANQQAISAGAKEEGLQVVEVDETPLAYCPGNATKIRVKAVGDLL